MPPIVDDTSRDDAVVTVPVAVPALTGRAFTVTIEAVRAVTSPDYFSEQLRRRVKMGDIVELGPIALLAHQVSSGRVTTVGLRLAEPEAPADLLGRFEIWWKRIQNYFG